MYYIQRTYKILIIYCNLKSGNIYLIIIHVTEYSLKSFTPVKSICDSILYSQKYDDNLLSYNIVYLFILPDCHIPQLK